LRFVHMVNTCAASAARRIANVGTPAITADRTSRAQRRMRGSSIAAPGTAMRGKKCASAFGAGYASARGDSVSAGLSLRPEANAGIGVCRRGVSHRALVTREILCQQDLRQQNFHADTHTAPARAGPLSAVMKPANRTRHLRVLKIPLTFWLVVQSLRSRRRAVAEMKRVPAVRAADHSTNFYRAVGSLRRCNERIERVFDSVRGKVKGQRSRRCTWPWKCGQAERIELLIERCTVGNSKPASNSAVLEPKLYDFTDHSGLRP
jgi:hypothetical protein